MTNIEKLKPTGWSDTSWRSLEELFLIREMTQIKLVSDNTYVYILGISFDTPVIYRKEKRNKDEL